MRNRWILFAISAVFLVALAAAGCAKKPSGGETPPAEQQGGEATAPSDQQGGEATAPSDQQGGEATAPADQQGGGATAPSEGTSAAAPSGDAEKGKEIYTATCVACHGADGQGTVGPGFVANPKVTTGATDPAKNICDRLSEADHINVVTNGRNAMPAKGGNSSLTDDDVKNVVAYERTEFCK